MNARAPKGTADMLPGVAYAWEHMLRAGADLFARYGYEPIYTPVFEHTEVFTRGIGEATDIVSKEMYTFEDKGGRSITLRPEGTASVVRSALEHSLAAQGGVAKVYYSGPMFRYERPQKGRMRQFWQMGVECLGAAGPSADAEVIVLLMRYFESLGIPRDRMTLLVNSMGDEDCRPAFRAKVREHILSRAGDLCEECRRRVETNPMRVFDCKNPACREAMSDAPKLRDELCPTCAEHYATVKTLLDAAGLAYVEDSTLVRGLDYYTRTVFEVQAQGLGSQNAIGGGVRYPRVLEESGGPPTPGLGWALGFERTLLALESAGVELPKPPVAQVFVARVADEVATDVFAIASSLRQAGLATEMDHQGRSLKAQFKQADRLGASVVVVVGPDELASGEVTVRDMRTREESRTALEGLADAVRDALA